MKIQILQKIANVIDTLPKDQENSELIKVLGDAHWEIENLSKVSNAAQKNQKVIMNFFEEYQNMAIDAE